MSETDAKLRWLTKRKSDLDEELEAASKDDSSGFSRYLKEDRDKIVAEIELLMSQSKSSLPKRKHDDDDDSEEGRWRLVGKTMNEVCIKSKLQDYVSQVFVYLHAFILKIMKDSNFCLRTVHFRFTSGHLRGQTLYTIFRYNTSFLHASISLTHNFVSQGAHAHYIHENLAFTSAARHSGSSNIF